MVSLVTILTLLFSLLNLINKCNSQPQICNYDATVLDVATCQLNDTERQCNKLYIINYS